MTMLTSISMKCVWNSCTDLIDPSSRPFFIESTLQGRRTTSESSSLSKFSLTNDLWLFTSSKMFWANLIHSSSGCRYSDTGSSIKGTSLTSAGVADRDVSSRTTFADDVSCNDDVTVRPDFRLVLVDLGSRRSDSDSSPDKTGELDRDVVVAPLPRRPFRFPEKKLNQMVV